MTDCWCTESRYDTVVHAHTRAVKWLADTFEHYGQEQDQDGGGGGGDDADDDDEVRMGMEGASGPVEPPQEAMDELESNLQNVATSSDAAPLASEENMEAPHVQLTSGEGGTDAPSAHLKSGGGETAAPHVQLTNGEGETDVPNVHLTSGEGETDAPHVQLTNGDEGHVSTTVEEIVDKTSTESPLATGDATTGATHDKTVESMVVDMQEETTTDKQEETTIDVQKETITTLETSVATPRLSGQAHDDSVAQAPVVTSDSPARVAVSSMIDQPTLPSMAAPSTTMDSLRTDPVVAADDSTIATAIAPVVVADAMTEADTGDDMVVD